MRTLEIDGLIVLAPKGAKRIANGFLKVPIKPYERYHSTLIAEDAIGDHWPNLAKALAALEDAK